MNIGDWIARERRGLAHLVESIVAGDAVMRCGRRMTDEPTKTGGRLLLMGPALIGCCQRCAGPAT